MGAVTTDEAAIDTLERCYADAAERGAIDVGVAEGLVAGLLGRLRTAPPLEALDLGPRRGPARYLPEHAWNVTRLGLVVALAERWDEADVAALGLAACWHDVGMGTVPPWRWLHARACEAEDRQAVRVHAAAGAAIVGRVGAWPPRVAAIVGQVHERVDGSGYPGGLAGDAIDPAARLLAVCDTYEALVSPRLYRTPFPPADAVRVVCAEAEAGRLDHQSVRAFVSAVGRWPVGSTVTLVDGTRARVVAANRADPDRPVVDVLADARGAPPAAPRRLDLAREPGVRILG